MNYTYTQLARVLPRSYRRQVWRARASRLWKRYLRVAAAIAGVLGAAILTIMYFVAARRRSRGWPNAPNAASRSAGLPVAPSATTSRRRASTEMKILGISAHYHDSAAALVVDGVPVCAVQEERLSRHKNDAGVSASARSNGAWITPGSSRPISTRWSSTSAAC